MKRRLSLPSMGIAAAVLCASGLHGSPVFAQMSVSTRDIPVRMENARPLQTQSPAQSTQKDKADTSLDKRLVSLSLRNVPLESVLTAIRKQTGVSIGYADRVVPVNQRVTLVVEKTPVLKALEIVLRGTSIVARTVAHGKIMLVPAQEPASPDSTNGAIKGRVTDGARKAGIPDVRITVEGTKIVAITGADGSYYLPGVPPGKYLLTARALGYSVVERNITVLANSTITIDFPLTEVPTRLQEVVTTGAGDRKRVEVGNSVGTIKAEDIVPTTPIRNLSDLLDGRVPGLQSLSTSGTVGAGSRIRIRGVSSILTSADPIVIIDGVRVDAAYSQPANTGVVPGGSSPAMNTFNNEVPATSRLNDIDPESIESIDVLKGPSASTLYGSDAANGVIVIKTKRGRAGPTRWSFSAQSGISTMKATFMDAWMGWGSSLSNPGLSNCALSGIARKTCTQDSVTRYNPLNHNETSPLGTGRTNRYGAQVSGGSAQVQYYLGMDYNDDVGLLELPAYDAKLYVARRNGMAPPDWMQRPNAMNSLHLTSKLTAQVGQVADFAFSSNVTRQSHRDVAQGTSGFVGASYSSMGYRDSIGAGWGQSSPGSSFGVRSSDRINRANGGINGTWRPTSYLSGRGTLGADYTSRSDERLQPADSVNSTNSGRSRSDGSTLMRSADLGGTLDLPIHSRFRLRSSVGGQYNRQDQDGAQINASGLTTGTEVINGATSISASETRSASATAGWYLEEMLGMNERAFMTVAVRGDAGSAFGQSAKAVLYPKWSGSWLLSQEPFFPRIPGLTNLRLRGAFGHAGVQPTVDARFRSYRASVGAVQGTPSTTIVISSVGNPQLRPERSAEFEGGFDFGLWNDRVTLDVTFYRKIQKDALVSRSLPPSFGIPARQENIGKVRNQGSEISATVQPIMTQALNWSSTFGTSRTRNTLLSLGPSRLPPAPGTLGEARYVVGYPLGGFWDRALLGYDDVNRNGIIEASELRLSDSSVYVGQAIPELEFSWYNNLALFSGWVNVGTSLSYQGGATQYNSALWLQCITQKCAYVIDPATNPTAQAIALGSIPGAPSWGYGMYERVSLLRWSELSVTVNIPQKYARLARARTANVSIMGRNLGMWSNYRGADPEVNTYVTGNLTEDSGGVPQARDWMIRFNFGF